MAEPGVDAPITDEERHAVQRAVVRALAALVAVVVAAGVVLIVTRHNNDGSGSIASDTTPVNAVGPLPGTAVATYMQRKQVALNGVFDMRAAAVSFTTYLTEAATRRLLEGFDVRSLLVAAPGGSPEVVRGGLDAWAASEKGSAADQRAQFEGLLQDTKDPDFIAQYKAEVARLTRLEQTVTPNGPVVFGAVVVADAAALHRLATTSGIRLVDVADTASVPADANIIGLRPEETTRANSPPTRPF